MLRTHFRFSFSVGMSLRASGSYTSAESIRWDQASGLYHAMQIEMPGVFRLNGREMPIRPHDLVVVPPGSRCEMIATDGGNCRYLYNSFVPVDGDREVHYVPYHTHLGEFGPHWNRLVRAGLNRLQFTRGPALATLHAMLWSVAVASPPQIKSVYVQEAERLISERIGGRIRIDELARELHISQAHLNRLFVSETGRTPLQFVREQRAILVHRKLTTTTDPLKQIAHECGFPDAHRLGRFVRERFGASPRAVRRERPALDVFGAGR